MRRRALLLVPLAVAACSAEGPTPPEPPAPDRSLFGPVRCEVSPLGLSCESAPAGLRRDGAVRAVRTPFGGQDLLIRLSTPDGVLDGVDDGNTTWAANVVVQNLMSQPMATTSDSGAALPADGSTRQGPEDVHVILSDGPDCTDGEDCGTISVANAHGTSSCLGSTDPFFGYDGGAGGSEFDGTLHHERETAKLRWEFELSNPDISRFQFFFFVCAEIPRPKSMLFWATSLDGTTTTPVASSVNGVWGAGPDVVWAVGTGENGIGGVIFRTADGGSTWTVQGGPGGEGGHTVADPLLAVHAVDASTAFAAGASGSFWRTTDGGSTWTESTPAVAEWRAVWAADAGTVWIGGSSGGDAIVMKSTDGGETFTQQSLPAGATNPVEAIWGADDREVWAVGGTIWRTTDGGSSWSEQSHPASNPLADVHGTSSTDVWAVGQGSDAPEILHWDGSAWSELESGLAFQEAASAGDRAVGVYAVGPDDVFVVSEGSDGTDADPYHWNGVAWMGMPARVTLGSSGTIPFAGSAASEIWASGPTDVWLALAGPAAVGRGER